MIKIDYEGAWKELKEEYGDYLIDCQDADDIRVKKAMDGLSKKHTREVFKVYMECVEMGEGAFIQDENWVKATSSEFTVNEMMSAKQCEYYHNAIMEGNIVDYKGKKIRITELTIPDSKIVKNKSKELLF